jgi:ATP-binding cassette subfamily C (CFTR/MRP) protein 1
LKRLDSLTRSPLFSHFSETLTGLSTIRAYSREGYFIHENHKKIDINQKANYPQLVSQRWLAVRLEAIGAVLIFTASIFLIIAKGTIEPGLAGLALTYALQVTGALSWTVRQATETENSMNAIERLVYYTESIESEAPEIIPTNRPTNWPRDGKIEFVNFDMRYRKDLPLILNQLTLTINGGEKVGVVGRTGAGKSSMMLALYRILESSGGNILIDGIDISTVGLFDLRKNISIIPQEPIMFAGTIRSNLDPFNEKSDDFLWDCLQKAHLKQTVEEFPNQLDYKIAEGGENLSVGQRQMMCLARALVKKSKILILDEATGSVDLKTDALIQKTVREQFADCTRLTIAHRLNTIIDSDRILVLDAGAVGEFDSPKNLVLRDDSLFTSMINETGSANARHLKSLALGLIKIEEDISPLIDNTVEMNFIDMNK